MPGGEESITTFTLLLALKERAADAAMDGCDVGGLRKEEKSCQKRRTKREGATVDLHKHREKPTPHIPEMWRYTCVHWRGVGLSVDAEQDSVYLCPNRRGQAPSKVWVKNVKDMTTVPQRASEILWGGAGMRWTPDGREDVGEKEERSRGDRVATQMDFKLNLTFRAAPPAGSAP